MPTVKPSVPVETKMPKALMSLPVRVAVSLPPQTWNSEFPMPSRNTVATAGSVPPHPPESAAAIWMTTADARETVQTGTSAVCRPGPRRSAHQPVSGCVMKARTL